MTPQPAVADPEALRKAAARDVRHPLSRTLLLLTVTTGVVDAVSYLGLGRVFTANMTGNIVLLGFGIAGSQNLPVVAPIVSLAAFVVGSRAGGALADRLADRRPQHVSMPLAIEVALVALAAVLAAAINVRPSHLTGYLLIALLAIAMGVRNSTIKRVAVPDLTTTVLTNTITGLATDFGKPGSGPASLRRLAAVLTMLAGALCGALLLKTSMWLALGVAAVLGAVALTGYAAAGGGEAG
jgi:uncharacterized membrane protein YoaK (UPF0700 family)